MKLPLRQVPKGGLEQRIRLAAFGLAMLLAVSLGLATLATQAHHAQRDQLTSHTATLKILANSIRSRLDRQVATLEDLSGSPLIWTGISDSVGRDAYLRPFLTSLNSTGADVMVVTLLDYRGRWVFGDRSQSDPQSEAIRTLAEKTTATRQPTASLVAGSAPRLLLAFPVLYPYTSDVIGVLIGNLSLDRVVNQQFNSLGDALGYQVQLNGAPLFAEPAATKERHQPVAMELEAPKHPHLYRFRIELFGTRSPWIGLVAELAAIYLATALVLAWIIWTVSGLLAKRLALRLTRLSDAVSGSRRPCADDIPPDTEQDEISRLAGVLRETLTDHARITARLEQLVEERTRDLAQSQERFQLANEGSRDGIWDWEIATDQTYFSARWKAMIGYREDELDDSFATFRAHLHPDDRGRVLASLEHYLKGDEAIFEEEFRFRHKDGSWRWVLTRGAALRDEHGKPYRMAGSHTDITDRKAAEERLLDSEMHLRAIIENEPECIKIVDGQGRLLQMNPAGLAMIGAESLDQVVGRAVLDLIAPEHRAAYAAMHEQVLAGQHMRLEYEVLGLKGGRRWVETHAVPMRDHGRLVHLAVTRDIDERRRAEDGLHLAASVFTNAREGIVITDADGNIVDVNETFTRITGYGRDEVMGKNPRIFGSGRQGASFYEAMWNDLIDKGYWQGEVWNRRKDGDIFAASLTISAVRDQQGATRHYVALFSDITEQKEQLQQIERVAHYDALTGLPNRVLLADRLHQSMTQTLRHGRTLAIAYLDLDGFKAINDGHGHEMGDQLLVAVANHMKQAVRDGDTVARLGGDEFVAVLQDLSDIEACVPLLVRLLGAIAQPVHVGGLTLQVSASLGVTFYPQTGDVDADQLLRQADQAMYQAKLAGKNRYHVFDADQDRSVRGHHESLEHIQRALAEGEFVLLYQPKVNMRSGRIIGAEALIRWQHPERGELAPGMFLPVIDDHLLAAKLGEWVIDTALTQMDAWRAAGLDLAVSVNVGAYQLQQPDFVDRLGAILARHPNFRPYQLELEVLETSALEDLAQASRLIADCQAIGVSFALDDFGSGYSSLTYLKRLPANVLKIDQSFVHDMLDDHDDLAIVEGVLGLASAFRRQAIAEGVETMAHGVMLLQLGCEFAQGFAIAHPMPAHELPGWAAAWRPYPAWVNQRAVSHDERPMLYATVEHRAWVSAIRQHIEGKRDALPPMDQHACHFGQWLDSDARSRYASQPGFPAIEVLHREVHDRGTALLALQAEGENDQARARLGELNDLRDTLLEQLQTLVQ